MARGNREVERPDRRDTRPSGAAVDDRVINDDDKEYSYRLRVRGIYKYDVPGRRDKWPADNKNGPSTRREINDDEETGGVRDRDRRRYPVVVSVACRNAQQDRRDCGAKYHIAQYIHTSLSFCVSQCTHRSLSVFHNGRSFPMVINDLLNFIYPALVCVLRSTGPTRSPRYTSWLLSGSVRTCARTHTHRFPGDLFSQIVNKIHTDYDLIFFLFFSAVG